MKTPKAICARCGAVVPLTHTTRIASASPKTKTAAHICVGCCN